MNSNASPCFLFAYGSLIWRPDFTYIRCWKACLHGYERRFWQASHDHRGTSAMPGRVLTLVPIVGGRCAGVLYQLADVDRDDILTMLDTREQDGYERNWLEVTKEGEQAPVTALTWLAAKDNPSWVGEQSITEIASIIAHRRGNSGSNKDYLIRLHEAFTQMGISDNHVEALVEAVGRLDARD